ncbi:hypothetical protein B0H13DRAFT_2360667 [Mycena leptocephala]|nr:hypothetical protein B0H13DRAFT_2360667 [Mycena leptocephala]
MRRVYNPLYPSHAFNARMARELASRPTLADTTPRQSCTRDITLEDVEWMKRHITEHGLDTAIGVDEFSYKDCPDIPNEKLLEFFQYCIKNCKVPQYWLTMLLIGILKKDKEALGSFTTHDIIRSEHAASELETPSDDSGSETDSDDLRVELLASLAIAFHIPHPIIETQSHNLCDNLSEQFNSLTPIGFSGDSLIQIHTPLISRKHMDSCYGFSPVVSHLAKKPRSPPRPQTRIKTSAQRLRAPRRRNYNRPDSAGTSLSRDDNTAITVVIHRRVKRPTDITKNAPSPIVSRLAKRPRSPPQRQIHNQSFNPLWAPQHAKCKRQNSAPDLRNEKSWTYHAVYSANPIHLLPSTGGESVDSGLQSAVLDISPAQIGRPDTPPPCASLLLKNFVVIW